MPSSPPCAFPDSEVFEEQVRSLASWYEAEKDGAVAARLAKLRGAESRKGEACLRRVGYGSKLNQTAGFGPFHSGFHLGY